MLPPLLQRFHFEVHHARPAYFMLTLWLPAFSVSPPHHPAFSIRPHHPPFPPCSLPPFANVALGVGGWVENAQGEVLVVQERTGPTAGRDFWKLPGGLVDHGEDLSAAAVREVMEETGVACDFERVLCVQQSHPGPWGTSSLYAVCRLAPKRGDQQPVRQESEIAAARWMDKRALAALPYYQAGLLKTVMQLAVESAERPDDGLGRIYRPHVFRSGHAELLAPVAALKGMDPEEHPAPQSAAAYFSGFSTPEAAAPGSAAADPLLPSSSSSASL